MSTRKPSPTGRCAGSSTRRNDRGRCAAGDRSPRALNWVAVCWREIGNCAKEMRPALLPTSFSPAMHRLRIPKGLSARLDMSPGARAGCRSRQAVRDCSEELSLPAWRFRGWISMMVRIVRLRRICGFFAAPFSNRISGLPTAGQIAISAVRHHLGPKTSLRRVFRVRANLPLSHKVENSRSISATCVADWRGLNFLSTSGCCACIPSRCKRKMHDLSTIVAFAVDKSGIARQRVRFRAAASICCISDRVWPAAAGAGH